mgnify:CR=1 FL=1
MKLIKEHINFERGLDPKEAMSIGEYSSRNFNTPEEFAKFVYNNLKKFTGYEPSSKYLNIHPGSNVYFGNNVFFTVLKTYMIKCNHTIDGYPINDYNNMKDWHEIFKELKKLLMENDITESINFQRGLDPKDAMHTGDIISRMKDKIRQFKFQ